MVASTHYVRPKVVDSIVSYDTTVLLLLERNPILGGVAHSSFVLISKKLSTGNTIRLQPTDKPAIQLGFGFL